MIDIEEAMYTANETALIVREDSSLLETLRILMRFFTKYLWMLTVTLGIPGNILTICVSLSRENRKISTSIYIAAVAAADTLVLTEELWGFSIMYWKVGTERTSQLALQ
jgi:hypothetical protein